MSSKSAALSTLSLSLVSVLLTACGSSGASTAAAPGGADQGAMSSDAVEMSFMDETPIEAAGATLYVQGLSCPACATNVDNQLKQVSGVTAIGVNLGDGTVQVGFDGIGGKTHPSRAALARAIHNSGFTLTRIEVGQ